MIRLELLRYPAWWTEYCYCILRLSRTQMALLTYAAYISLAVLPKTIFSTSLKKQAMYRPMSQQKNPPEDFRHGFEGWGHLTNRVSSQTLGIFNKGIKVLWIMIWMEKVSVLLNLTSSSLRTDSKPFLSRQEKWRITDPSAQTFIKLTPALGRSCQKITSFPFLCGTYHLECHFPWDDLCTALGRVLLYC